MIKTLPSSLTIDDLQRARMRGAAPGGPEPAPPAIPRIAGRLVLPPGGAVDIARSVIRDGIVRVANRTYTVDPGLAGQRITLRLDGHLMHAIANGQLGGTWPCPIPADQVAALTGAQLTVGPLPHAPPRTSISVRRRVPLDGVTMAARQRLRIGRTHAGKAVTVVVEDTHFRILHDGEELSVHPRDPNTKANNKRINNRRKPD